MSIVRWSPFRDMLGIQDEMNRLFNAYFTRSSDQEGKSLVWHPFVDIFETDNEIKVVAEVPGMNKEDIKVSIQDNVLTISGVKKQEADDTSKNYHRIERAWGTFERSFSLPMAVRVDKVNAAYKDGILTITLPKSEEAKPKEIDVSVT